MGCKGSKLDDQEAVALCRGRSDLLAAAVRHRYALADAHGALADSLESLAAAAASSPPPGRFRSSRCPQRARAACAPPPPRCFFLPDVWLTSTSGRRRRLDPSQLRRPTRPTTPSPSSSQTRITLAPQRPVAAPRSPPRESSWAFLNVFENYEPYDSYYYYDSAAASVAAYTPSRSSREVREEEGIPDLEDDDGCVFKEVASGYSAGNGGRRMPAQRRRAGQRCRS
ncbi:hypothetical protein GUJ93_ZPchr0004g38412 [Zizania palustris]|uniref:DUF630 domain-containing protein n=1 Tax=Zizania palustris TaxID=103762 RepID=A0A8J5T1B6_ZIZPA|nr:hypothetical protein GUJ93_ZPchr0004g38412 [Zizania palustris]